MLPWTGRTCVTRGIWFTICVHSLFKVVIMAQESIVYCACCIHTDPGPQEDSIDSLGCQIARTFKGHLTCPCCRLESGRPCTALGTSCGRTLESRGCSLPESKTKHHFLMGTS